MAVEFIEEIPGRRGVSTRGRVPYPAKEIDTFLEAKDQRYAKVTIEGKLPKNMAQSFRLYLKKHPDVAEKVAVHLIDGELYLERRELAE